MRQNPHVRICGGPGSATTLVYPTAPKREGEMLTASRERGVIGGREIDAQHPEDRCQEALGLTHRSVEEETERQGGFDGEIGILELPAPPADASRCPRGDRVGREPEGDVASPHEGSVVLGPELGRLVRWRTVPAGDHADSRACHYPAAAGRHGPAIQWRRCALLLGWVQRRSQRETKEGRVDRKRYRDWPVCRTGGHSRRRPV